MEALLDNILIIGIVSLIILLLIVLIIIKRPKKDKPLVLETKAITDTFGKDNIKSIDFIRNKIVVEVKDNKRVDLEQLKSMHVEGINVVGNKVKFYFEKDTEILYEQLKNDFER